MPTARAFQFKPRYRGVAITAMGVGGSLSVVSAIWAGLVFTLPLVSGVVGIALGAAYLRSPTWRLSVSIDDDGLSVDSHRGQKFRLAWGDIVKVIASPTTNSCFVDGGAPERSLLVPGDGAPAPYDIVDRPALYAAILAHVATDKVRIVESLATA